MQAKILKNNFWVYASAVFRRDTDMKAPQKMQIPLGKFAKVHSELKKILPSGPIPGFSVWYESAEDTFYADWNPVGIYHEGMMDFPHDTIILNNRFRGIVSRFPISFLEEKNRDKTCLVDNGSLIPFGLHMIRCPSENALLEINGNFYPLSYQEHKLTEYADLISDVYRSGKSILCREWHLDDFSGFCSSFAWISTNPDNPKVLNTAFCPYTLAAKLRRKLRIVVHSAWSGEVFQNLSASAEYVEANIEKLQNLIDEHLPEIRNYAVSHAYDADGVYHIIPQPSTRMVLPTTRYDDDDAYCLPLDWHDIPVGAVGNAFRYLDVLQAEQGIEILTLMQE